MQWSRSLPDSFGTGLSVHTREIPHFCGQNVHSTNVWDSTSCPAYRASLFPGRLIENSL